MGKGEKNSFPSLNLLCGLEDYIRSLLISLISLDTRLSPCNKMLSFYSHDLLATDTVMTQETLNGCLENW